MAKNINSSQNDNDLNVLDKAAKKIIEIIDPSYRERKIITGKNSTIQSVINRQLELTKGFSGENIIDFIQAMDTRNNGYLYKNRVRDEEGRPLNYENIFTENISDIFNYFQSQYRNKYLEMTDLKLISKFVPSMSKAVRICISSICNSDDISDNIIRNIVFPDGTTSEDKSTILKTIETFEKDLKLKKKLKNTVYKTTLVTGEYYVYRVPYTRIFEEYDRLDAAGYFKRMNMGYNVAKNTSILRSKSDKGFNIHSPAKESYTSSYSEYDNEFLSIATENFKPLFKDSMSDSKIEKEINEIIGDTSIRVHNSSIFYEALEQAFSMKLFEDSDKMMNRSNDELKKLLTTDGTLGLTKNIGWADPEYRTHDTSKGDFAISGTYVKFIEPKQLVAIEIFNQTVGYFYIHPTPQKITKNAYKTMTSPSSLIGNTKLHQERKDDLIAGIADVISTGIMSSFSGKFIQEHQQFKELIAECLISNGLANNDYHIQFIPATDITKFVVNEDEKEHGVSILADSLFPAKLLLDLIICKLLVYFNKSGNRQVAHIHKGPIDQDTYNQTQRTLRMLQDSTITFNDLMSSNVIFSKFARDTNMQFPTDANGNKIVELEQMMGQDVDLNTPMEDKLEKMAIQGTPVPSTFLEAIEDMRFSRQIISDHIEFASAVSEFQADLEASTTDLYRALLANTSLPDELKRIASRIEFKLPRPKVLQNTNSSEFISTAVGGAEAIANIIYGSDTSDSLSNKKKMALIQLISKDALPFLPWDKYEDFDRQAEIDIAEKEKITKKSTTEDDSMSSEMDDF